VVLVVSGWLGMDWATSGTMVDDAGVKLRALVEEELRLLAERDRRRLGSLGQTLTYLIRILATRSVSSGIGSLLFAVIAPATSPGHWGLIPSLVSGAILAAFSTASTWTYLRTSRRIDRSWPRSAVDRSPSPIGRPARKLEVASRRLNCPRSALQPCLRGWAGGSAWRQRRTAGPQGGQGSHASLGLSPARSQREDVHGNPLHRRFH
jgi:hypothetical protein